VDDDAQGDAGGGGAKIDVTAQPPGKLFSETNDDSVVTLLASDAEAKGRVH